MLDREACYRAIGEGFAHVGQHIDFTQWYASELQQLLQRGYQVKSCFLLLESIPVVQCALTAPAAYLSCEDLFPAFCVRQGVVVQCIAVAQCALVSSVL